MEADIKEIKEIRENFARVAKLATKNGNYREQSEWENIGIAKFKRRVLGLCGDQTVKSLDDLASILKSMRFVDSVDEARNFIPRLYGKKLEYKDSVYLTFTLVKTREGRESCKISYLNEFPYEI